MKKIIIALSFFASTMTCYAQTGWETVDNQQEEVKQEKKALFGNKKDKVILSKYHKGAVTDENGRVCWTKTYELPGLTGADIYAKALATMQKLVKTEKQTNKSIVAVVNRNTNQIGVRLCEHLVFSNKLLSLDQTLFNYHLFVACSDGKCTVKLTNITYRYEIGRPTEVNYTAEEMISDAVSFNKKGTKYTKGGTKKFREKTIDRKDEVFAWIGEELKK